MLGNKLIDNDYILHNLSRSNQLKWCAQRDPGCIMVITAVVVRKKVCKRFLLRENYRKDPLSFYLANKIMKKKNQKETRKKFFF